MASLRECITGPFAKILVGHEQEEFLLPKSLLVQSSVYFDAALNGQFAEAAYQRVNLETEDPGVFRTYATWLYRDKLIAGDIRKVYSTTAEFELHIVALLAFADRRNIKLLHEDVCVMLHSYLAIMGSPLPETIHELYDLPKSNDGHRALRRFIVQDELFKGSRLGPNEIGQFPKEFIQELVQKLLRGLKVKNRLFSSHDTVCPHDHYEEKVLCALGFLHKSRDYGRCPEPLPDVPEQLVSPASEQIVRPAKKPKFYQT